MAIDAFLKIEGPDVKGESVVDGHKDEIDVLSWAWGGSNSGSAHTGGGAGSGKVNVQDLSITKYIDKSTPDLLKSLTGGQHFNKATLIARKAGGDNPVDYLKIEMNGRVFVTSYSTGGAGGEDRITENITLNFEEVFVEYAVQTSTGASGEKPNIRYNIAEGKRK